MTYAIEDGFIRSFFLLCGALTIGVFMHCCSPAQSVRTTLNVSAAAANAAAPSVLAAQCEAELGALHHSGAYVAGRCVRSDEPRIATDPERAALTQVRAHWAPVMSAYEAFADAHDAARVVSDEATLQRVVEAYSLLRQAARGVGLELPGVQ